MYRIVIVFLAIGLALILVGPAGQRAEAGKPSGPVAQPTSEPALTYDFQFLTSKSRIDTVGSTIYYVVEGVLRNTGATNAREVRVRAKLFSALGPELTEDSEPMFLDIVTSGATSPFQVYVRYPDTLVGRYELDAVGYETDEQPRRNVVLVNDTFSIRDGRRYWYGEWQNNDSLTVETYDGLGTNASQFVAIPFNGLGQILDYWHDNIYHYINPGGRSPFSVYTSSNNPVARWEYWVNYHVLDPGTYGNYASLENLTLVPGSFAMTARGLVTNKGDQPLQTIFFTVMFRDAQGRVLNWGRPAVFTTPIPPGQSAQVSGNLYSHDIPSSYDHFDGYVLSDYKTSIQPPTLTPSPTLPATATSTATDTSTPTPTASPTITPTPTVTATPTITLTPTVTLRPTPDGGYVHFAYLPHLARGE